jgi:hypothetical protein
MNTTPAPVRPLGRWKYGMYVVAGSVVGTVSEGADQEDWFAHGCLDDWQDIQLGCHRDEKSARIAVEEWAEEHAD